jgi:hypothetical protein
MTKHHGHPQYVPANPYANRLPLVTGPTIRMAAPRTSASPDG